MHQTAAPVPTSDEIATASHETESDRRLCEQCHRAMDWRDALYGDAAAFQCKRCTAREQRDRLNGHYVKLARGPNRATRRAKTQYDRRVDQHQRRWLDTAA